MPICLRLLTQWILRAACLAWLSAGNKREARMAISTRISTKVNPQWRPGADEFRFNDSHTPEVLSRIYAILDANSQKITREREKASCRTHTTIALRRSSKSARNKANHHQDRQPPCRYPRTSGRTNRAVFIRK